MIRWIHAAALGVAASFLVPASAYAQSLADVAAREKERRAADSKKVKSYSEDDLRGGGTISSFETSSDDSAAPSEGTEAESGEGSPQQEGTATAQKSEDERASQEKAWRARVKIAQDTMNGTAAEIEGIQKSLADNTGNYYSTARTSMLNRLDALTKKYAADKDALDALREEGRRNSFRE